MQQIVLRTPLWKEVLLAVFAVACIALSAALLYFGYQEGAWLMVGLGAAGAGFFIPALFLEAASRVVLVADAEGLFVHPYALAKKKRFRWDEIAGFEKSVQVMPKKGIGPEQKYEHLVVRLKRPEQNETMTTAFFAQTFSSSIRMDEPFVPGDLYIPHLRLPGKVDDLVLQLREYQARVTGVPANPNP